MCHTVHSFDPPGVSVLFPRRREPDASVLFPRRGEPDPPARCLGAVPPERRTRPPRCLGAVPPEKRTRPPRPVSRCCSPGEENQTPPVPRCCSPGEENQTPPQVPRCCSPGEENQTPPVSRGCSCRLAASSFRMLLLWILAALCASSAEADFFPLDSISNVSSYYFNYIYCNIWEGECQPHQDDAAQQVPTRDLWAGFPQDYMSLAHQWYCSLGQCCDSGDCRVTNNITGLAWDLQTRLHGQHLVQSVVLKAVQGFLSSPESNKPLTLSFHGWSGTGKNYVARIIADNLYRDGVKSECVRLFIAPFHFPHARLVDTYKGQLRESIRDLVLRCPQTLFIFDEAEKLHPGLIDAIKPFMDHYDNVDGVNYRRALFLFLSNIGGATINDVALDFWHSGQNREDIGMEDLEHRLRAETMESHGGFAQSELMSGHLIDFFVPFLPLEYRHVKLCARDAFTARGLQTDEATLDEVAKAMLYVPKEERLFSAQGCKSIPQRINFFLP